MSTSPPLGKVFFNVGMTLDGFIAPDGMDLEHADDPGYKDWLRRWTELQSWVFEQRFFRQTLQLGEGERPVGTTRSWKRRSIAPA